MKTKFSNSETAHVFAQQTQSHGDSFGRNVFFRDNKLYSYGYHYTTAHITAKNEVIINNIGYSNSTSKHISDAQSALSHYNKIFYTDINLEYNYYEVCNLVNRIPTARKNKDKYKAQVIQIYNTLQQWSDKAAKQKRFSEYRINKKDKQFRFIQAAAREILSGANFETFLIEQKKRETAADKRKQKIARQKAQLKYIEHTKQFFNYERGGISYDSILILGCVDRLRISSCGLYAETSKNLSIEADKAIKLYKAITGGLNVKGYKIGYYTINGIETNANGTKTLLAGCHNIALKDCIKVGKQLVELNK